MDKSTNKVENVNSVELNKKYIVVYSEEGWIVVIDYDNIRTFPGVGRLYAEFDTAQELDDYVLEHNLIPWPDNA